MYKECNSVKNHQSAKPESEEPSHRTRPGLSLPSELPHPGKPVVVAEIDRLRSLRPSAYPTIQRAIDVRIAELEQDLQTSSKKA
jgi:hypothetical protein